MKKKGERDKVQVQVPYCFWLYLKMSFLRPLIASLRFNLLFNTLPTTWLRYWLGIKNQMLEVRKRLWLAIDTVIAYCIKTSFFFRLPAKFHSLHYTHKTCQIHKPHLLLKYIISNVMLGGTKKKKKLMLCLLGQMYCSVSWPSHNLLRLGYI